jgi:hypothetical protein
MNNIEDVQKFLDEGVQNFAHILYQGTGLPPKAVIVIVHFPEDILFSASMASAPPQAQMNAIDAMISHLRKCAEKLKAAINTARHGGMDTKQ